MRQQGRKSSAALQLIESGQVQSVRRPAPPEELNSEAAAVWRGIVEDMPADWFSEGSRPLLVQYCRHVVASRRIAELIATIEIDPEFDVREYQRAMTMQDRCSASIGLLAVKMRLAQQSSYQPQKVRSKQSSVKPWAG
jgi:hypothetical protein